MAILAPLAVRFLAPSLITKGEDSVLQVDVEREGVEVTITTPSLLVYTKDGLLAGSPFAVTTSGTTLSATVGGSATTDIKVSGRWMVQWKFTVTGDRAYRPYNAAALCLADLQCPVGVTDITARHTQMSILLGSAATVQAKITQAWGELVSKLYADETPFWNLRSGSVLRPWLIARTRELCFSDMATAHHSGAIYADAAIAAGELAGPIYSALHVRMDDDGNNTLTARSVPVNDPRLP